MARERTNKRKPTQFAVVLVRAGDRLEEAEQILRVHGAYEIERARESALP